MTHALVTLRFCRVELSLFWTEFISCLNCCMVNESFSLRPELSFLSFPRSSRYFQVSDVTFLKISVLCLSADLRDLISSSRTTFLAWHLCRAHHSTRSTSYDFLDASFRSFSSSAKNRVFSSDFLSSA